MPKVLAGEGGKPDGLRFRARKATISPANISLNVKMDQQGSFLELRDQKKELLFRLDGRQLDELYSKNQLDVTRPERLKQSVIQVWEKSRPEPPEPNEFVLDLRDVDPEQLKGRLKILIDWVDDHVQSDLAVDPHKHPEEPVAPAPEASPAPEESAPPPPEESAPPASEPPPESAPPASEEEPEEEEPEQSAPSVEEGPEKLSKPGSKP